MGQFQGVPGPSQDAFDAQTQAIANKIKWQVLSTNGISVTNAWTNFDNSCEIDLNYLYYVILTNSNKATHFSMLLSGNDLKNLTTTTPGILASGTDFANATSVFISYNTSTNKFAYYCGANVAPSASKSIYILKCLNYTA